MLPIDAATDDDIRSIWVWFFLLIRPARLDRATVERSLFHYIMIDMIIFGSLITTVGCTNYSVVFFLDNKIYGGIIQISSTRLSIGHV